MGEVTGAEMHAVKTADERLFLMKNPPMPQYLLNVVFCQIRTRRKNLQVTNISQKLRGQSQVQ